MKPFVAPYSVGECKMRLADLSESDMLGLSQIKVKFVPIGDHDCRYVLRKTMRDKYGRDFTMAELTGNLVFDNDKFTSVGGKSHIGRVYKGLFIFYLFAFMFGLRGYLTTQQPHYLTFVGIGVALIGFTWLLTFYWRNQLECKVKRALMMPSEKKKSLPDGKPLHRL